VDWNIRGLALSFEYYATARQNGYLTNRFEWKTKTMTVPKGWEDGDNPCRANIARFLRLSLFGK